MNKRFCFLFFSLFLSFTLFAQKLEILTHRSGLSIRGLSVVNDKVIWVSGTDGTVGRSVNGGKDWKWITVKNCEKRDFRDIEAFDQNTAIIMAVSEPAQILKTVDGGQNWSLVFSDSTKGMFLDAMDFVNDSLGIVVGDPINNQVYIAYTRDQGKKWIAEINGPSLVSGEALFAASGSNIKCYWDKEQKIADFLFVTGGYQSRLFSNDQAYEIPIVHGKQSTGANSLAIDLSSGRGIIVGGDFTNDTSRFLNCFLFEMRNKRKWFPPASGPHGYRSCVEFLNSNRLITCGYSGVDISDDGGNTWKLISREGFNVCRKARTGQLTILAGADGRIGRLKW